MKILHFYKTAYPDTRGGIEQVIHQLARGCARQGIQVDVLALSAHDTQSQSVDNYQYHRAKKHFQLASTDFSLSVFKQFSELAKQADLIHYHFPWPFMDVVHFLTGIKKPAILTYHSDIIRQKKLLRLYRPLKMKFLSSMRHIVATSPNYLATSEVLRAFSGKTSAIPIGLDKESYPKPSIERLNHWRNRVGHKFFLFVGVLRYYKGLHILIEAAAGRNYPVVILGSGPVEKELKKQAETSGLNNIVFAGFLPDEDKVALLTLCYAVLFPSHLRSEAFGVSLLEGAMFAKPMISTEIGTGTSYINIHEKTGLVIEPANPEALRNAMDYIWQNPDQAERMGRMAQQRYYELFQADRMVQSYVNQYKNALTMDGL